MHAAPPFDQSPIPFVGTIHRAFVYRVVAPPRDRAARRARSRLLPREGDAMISDNAMIAYQAKGRAVMAGTSYIALVLADQHERSLEPNKFVVSYEMRTPDAVEALIADLRYWLDSGRIRWEWPKE